jgi:DNA-binding SARP family transcriptional activator
MLIRLLGPVDVLADDGPREVRGLRRKAVLAALALHGGEVVSAGRLAEVVWGEDAPPTVVNTLQTHVSYLRTVLGSKNAIRACRPGYLLDLGGDSSDVQVAERLLREGTSSADPAQAVRHLRTALALWHGQSLADVTGVAWLEEQAVRLDLLCLQVRRALAEARLAAGEHADLVPELEEMVAESPLDERVYGQLMLALYRCGRQADALAVFGRLRAVLAEQLGIDPSPVIRHLQTAILRQDEALTVPARPLTALAAPLAPVPAQLPPAVPGFAGRAAELASLDAVLARAERERGAGSAAVVISAVSGTAGVGKTALAVQWAHRVAARFPDGQLYVNLRGFGPGGQPVEPAEAVRGFLAGMGVAQDQVPDGAPAQTALYRSLLAGKRVLVVLDNARDAGQVRPLLPGSPGCLAIVTSRSDLAGLVAAEGAYPVSLDLLPPAEAGELLAHRLGEARVASEPAAVSEIIERCARLPLALAIAAARAASRPGFPLAAIAAGLRRATATLDPFGGTDPATDVRAVFSWSCRLLSADAARLFALLGLHPGPDISVPAAASLAAVPPGRAEALLAELAGRRPHQAGRCAPERRRLRCRPPGLGAGPADTRGDRSRRCRQCPRQAHLGERMPELNGPGFWPTQRACSSLVREASCGWRYAPRPRGWWASLAGGCGSGRPARVCAAGAPRPTCTPLPSSPRTCRGSACCRWPGRTGWKSGSALPRAESLTSWRSACTAGDTRGWRPTGTAAGTRSDPAASTVPRRYRGCVPAGRG